MSALFATCPKGLEYLLRDELAALGAGTAREALAGVHFEGDLELAYRACLHSRLASRVLLPLARFDAADAEALYRGVAAIDWERHLAPDGSLAVDAVVAQSAINHSGFAAQRVKDAVVDQLRERCGMRPSVVLERPQLRLHLHLRRDRAELALDLSGEPLHRRGWRVDQGAAPLKENLAAAMLLRAGWPALYADGGALVDPLCGGGTLLIEAALMAAGVAAGLRRDYYGFLGWRGHDAALWARLHAQATAQAHDGLAALRPAFFGRDQDPGAIAIARRNAQAAAVAGFVHLERGDIAHLAPPAGCARGLLIGNPPYGERLGERDEVVALYRTLGERLRAGFVGWRAALLIGEAEMGHAFGLRADRRYALYNGALACTLLTFEIAARDQPATEPRPLGAGAAMA
ncbi:MAG: 23S rRNA (guanine(2445)-N(2))/(guanine(2069)-N(7))-methyltransferase, partial [Xanthomonadaceae bacterium]|nr:23S rRNA (guanine(2445)-N(2))/(guanine(2069)-N(7))-methyltransferase [Xanthomonadaceae bacterium]